MASEVVGKFLMILITIALFATLYFLLIPQVQNAVVFDAHCSVYAYLKDESIVIEHAGGNPLEVFETTNNGEVVVTGTDFKIGDIIKFPVNTSNDNVVFLFDFPENNKRMVADFAFVGTGWIVEEPPLPFTTIQEAIDNASVGDTISIPNGTYDECININKSVTLVSEDANGVVINGGDCFAVRITSENVSIDDIEIVGNNVGLWIESNNFTITNCEISSLLSYGVWLYSATNGTIDSCVISNSTNAMRLDNSNDNTIIDNIISNSNNGIIFGANSCRNIIRQNNIFGNIIKGIDIQEGYDNNINHNEFVNIGDNGYDVCGNTWDGNGWNDFVENPYIIQIGNQDNNGYLV